jgi:aspartyl-tRNA(Asn)/glutamyl-tRNA(Gln) amidotransferase subunit A
MKELVDRSVTEHAVALNRKEYSSRELTQAYLDRIERLNGTIGAYLTVTGEKALREADASDTRRKRGEALGALDGIPYALKDNICTKGIFTTCASRMLENYMPPYDATVVEKLRSCGGVLLGKLNMDEFAMGASTEHSAFRLTRNPIDLSRVPGGSSGGSAAAVCARMAAYTLGSDTAGSIRQPAAFCGVVGMKPTYGRVSRFGLVAFASSLEQIGPITGSVEDNALVLETICGWDARDATTLKDESAKFTLYANETKQPLRIGVPKELLGDDIDDTVRNAVVFAADRYRSMGVEVKSVSLPSLGDALAAYYVISSAEASSNLARFDGVRYGYRSSQFENLDSLYRHSRSEGFGMEVKRRILLGTLVLSAGYYDAYYQKAMAVRRRLKKELEQIWNVCDLLLSPSAPTVAYPIGEKSEDPLEMYRGDLCGVAANLAGLPALSIPCGTDENGLPIGLQLIGKAMDERTLYRAAAMFM